MEHFDVAHSSLVMSTTQHCDVTMHHCDFTEDLCDDAVMSQYSIVIAQ